MTTRVLLPSGLPFRGALRLRWCAILFTAGLGVAQGAPVGEGGVSQEGVTAEVARRRLLLLPPEEVPVQDLTRQLGDTVDDLVWRAA